MSCYVVQEHIRTMGPQLPKENDGQLCGLYNDVYVAGGGNPMRTPPYPIAPTYIILMAAAAHSRTAAAHSRTAMQLHTVVLQLHTVIHNDTQLHCNRTQAHCSCTQRHT